MVDMQVTHNRPLTAMTDDELLHIVAEERARPALTIDADQIGVVSDALAVPLAVDQENTEDLP